MKRFSRIDLNIDPLRFIRNRLGADVPTEILNDADSNAIALDVLRKANVLSAADVSMILEEYREAAGCDYVGEDFPQPTLFQEYSRPILLLLDSYAYARLGRMEWPGGYDLRQSLFYTYWKFNEVMPSDFKRFFIQSIGLVHISSIIRDSHVDRAEFGFLTYVGRGLDWVVSLRDIYKKPARHGIDEISGILRCDQSVWLEILFGVNYDDEHPRCDWEVWGGDHSDSTADAIGVYSEMLSSFIDSGYGTVVQAGLRQFQDS